MWTWLSRYQNVSILDFIGAKGDGGGQHLGGGRDGELAISRSSFPSFFTGRMPILSPNQQRQSTEREKRSRRIEKQIWIQRRAEDFSLGTKNEGPKSERGWCSWGGSSNPSAPARSLGSAVSSLEGSGQSPDCPQVFHYFQLSGWPLL